MQVVRDMPIQVDGENLTIEDVVLVSRQRRKASLAESAKAGIAASREVIKTVLREGKLVYGVNTGFGDLSQVCIEPADIERLQVNLIRSHSAGVGDLLDPEIVRAMILLRVNALAKGYSAVRLEVIETLLSMLNADVTPAVPEQGSVGSSGDLAPLAHMALVVMGEGEALFGGKMVSGLEAMKKAKLKPLRLQAKEGVALINGTQCMSAIGALVLHDAMNLIRDAAVAASMSLEALRGTRIAFDERIHSIRPHEGQRDIAQIMRVLLDDSEINKSHADCGKIQDAYSLRCIPQVLGASLDTIRYVRSIIETEINSATDNPLVFSEDGSVISGGNFHGQPVAFAMDFLGIALSEIASISERRTNRLVNPHLSGLPAFLTTEGGLESGMMIAQYTAAALVSENKILAHPASVDSIPTSADQEDHVSMGTIAARKARRILVNSANVVAIEYLCAAQGLDLLAPLMTSGPLQKALKAIRGVVKMLEDDRPLHTDISGIRALMDSRSIVSAAEEITGFLLEE
ncbi:MAG: histidine ammonia-lyase [Candidatus Thorarchaeota archaeon]|jgi:histidine ammonia-lyase